MLGSGRRSATARQKAAAAAAARRDIFSSAKLLNGYKNSTAEAETGASARTNGTRDASRRRAGSRAPHCSDWSESRDKKDRQGLGKDLGYFHSHD